ncbi:hypothetical protein F2P56_024619 [Juglans regia]|uniref:Uncharacterized protein n=2 Tax=Juglans regia TaxID=51240 RepID=A0A833U754_JUGRE|nr:uncharacterized protein LOC109018617 isoform X3 [Juglans regia]KAF5454999.1 hypothetical protein F2P56_024619 [Juglans regia]
MSQCPNVTSYWACSRSNPLLSPRSSSSSLQVPIRERDRAMEEAEVLELYEIQYSDLMLLSSTISSSSSSSSSSLFEETDRLKLISRGVMEALGPPGPGLLSISGVPDASTLRQDLLPLARSLALLNPDERKRILKEHNLGSDVPLKNPDRSVSSFAMQLRYAQWLESVQSELSHGVDSLVNPEQDHLEVHITRESQDIEFRNLGNTFRKLGFIMMDLGLRIAQICDRAIGEQELEQSLLDSCVAKGRLIHYHSALDNIILNEARSKKTAKRLANGRRDEKNSIRYQHGLSEGPNLDTNATEPNDLFSVCCDEECPSPSGHTYLQIFYPNKNNVCMVKVSAESFIIQVGESADIISKGKLRSALHSVSRAAKFESLSRQAFVVFLQPAWNKTFSISDYPVREILEEETNLSIKERNQINQEIQKILPPLSSRLKDGMTFAEFSRETTKQYYGGSGLQSNR